MRKRLWLALGIGLLAMLVVLEILSLPAQLSRAKYGRIKPGMSMEEITAILGRLPDGDRAALPPSRLRDVMWLDPDAWVRVGFDEQDRATIVEVNPLPYPTWFHVQLMRLGMTKTPRWLGYLDDVRWRLGW
jgi:hypothetical protein